MKTTRTKKDARRALAKSGRKDKGGRGRIFDTYRMLGISTVFDAPFCGAEEFGIMVGYKTGLYSDSVTVMSAGTEE